MRKENGPDEACGFTLLNEEICIFVPVPVPLPLPGNRDHTVHVLTFGHGHGHEPRNIGTIGVSEVTLALRPDQLNAADAIARQAVPG